MTLLVTGGSGTLGKAVCSEAIRQGKQVVAYSRDRSTQLTKCPKGTTLETGDVTDLYRLVEVCRRRKVTEIVHCAAMKHVGECEERPGAVLTTNLLGLQNVLEAMRVCDIGSLVFVSSDKAGDNSLYGMSKLWGERMVAEFSANSSTVCSVRPGNLIGSNGSVVDIWRAAAKQGQPLRLDVYEGQSACRFVMHAREAAQFILKHLGQERHGTVLTREMPIVRMAVLLESLFPDVKPVYGPLAPDQLHQDLIRPDESLRTTVHDDEFCLGHLCPPHNPATWCYSTRDRVPMNSEETLAWLNEELVIPPNAVCS